MIYIQGTHTEQTEYKLTTQNLSWIFQRQNSRSCKYVICSAASTSYYALSEDQFITHSVFSIKRRKTAPLLTARFYYFQSFKQRRKRNSGFNFSCCLLASQSLHPVTQDIRTCFVYYALIFYLLPNFCSKQTKNQTLVQKCFLFPCPLTPHTPTSHFEADFRVLQQRVF